MKPLRLLVPFALLVSLMLACGPLGAIKETPSPAEEPTGGEEAAATEAPSGGEAGTEGEEEIELSSVTSGLQSLDSYRAHFKMAVTDTAGGGTEEWAYEMDMEVVRDPFAQHMVIQGVAAEGAFEMFQIGDQRYIALGEGQCISTSAEGEAMGAEMFEPGDVIGGLSNARRVRPDQDVNGIRCRHYKFNETALVWRGFTKAEGEVWVAVEGEYVVKYALQAEGKDPASGKEGHLDWVYEIRDVNEPISIEPPAGCGAAESEYPMMPDATDVSTMENVVMYTSASSLDDVLAFYKGQMPANGWSETRDSFTSEGTAMQSYTKEGVTVSLTLTEQDGKVSVLIMSQ